MGWPHRGRAPLVGPRLTSLPNMFTPLIASNAALAIATELYTKHRPSSVVCCRPAPPTHPATPNSPPAPCVKLPLGDVLLTATLPHAKVRDAVSPLNVVDQVLDKADLVSGQDDLRQWVGRGRGEGSCTGRESGDNVWGGNHPEEQETVSNL